MKITLPVLATILLLVACSPRPGSDPSRVSSSPVTPGGPEQIEIKDLHNVHRLADQIYCGSSPHSEAGFQSLKDLGIRTILSVDGARPQVALARKFGLRYVHVPIGYDGIPREQALQIARAVRDLPGPIYLHCHHGKHRGPTAAALARLSLDPNCTIEKALEEMRRAGTDPKYTGLFATIRNYQRPSAREIDAIPATFPEVAPVAGLPRQMVDIDQCWEHLKIMQSAGWKTPAGHPDIDPPHEALLLKEHYHEVRRLPEIAHRPEEFRRWLAEAEHQAADLEKLLRAIQSGDGTEITGANQLFQQVGAACSRCHDKYRDVPGPR